MRATGSGSSESSAFDDVARITRGGAMRKVLFAAMAASLFAYFRQAEAAGA
jgi:hypothetical protein